MTGVPWKTKALFRRQKLQKALEKAIDWQQAVETKAELINGNTYFGPHKWIICLLGSDVYPVNDFISNHETQLKYSTNFQISFMALTDEPLDSENVKDY